MPSFHASHTSSEPPSSEPPSSAQPPGQASGPANPFLAIATEKPLVAIRGARNGYIMLAPSQETLHYGGLPDSMLLAAKAWAATLENLGSPRAYWITLSELTPHLHIHIFPRWPEDALKGIPLFESRDSAPQPVWTPSIEMALDQWANQFSVEVNLILP